MPFHFFSLPPELRNMVYIEVLASGTDTETARTQYLHGHTPFLPCSIPTSLLLTNRQIHTEASPLLWTHRFWQSRICYDSTLFDFREPLWNLPPPSLLPFIQNLEITLRNPRINDYVLEPEDTLKRQKEISGTIGKLLAILVDEVVSHRPHDYPYLKTVLVHLPCICPRCDNPDDLGEGDRGPFWEPPDTQWKAGMTAHSLSVLLHPLRRLRVSQKLEFRFDCRHSGFPGAFEPVFAGIASLVVGETPVEALSGERGVFRDLWVEARERGMEEEMVVEELQHSFWYMDDGFGGRRMMAGEWFLRGVEMARAVMRGEEGLEG